MRYYALTLFLIGLSTQAAAEPHAHKAHAHGKAELFVISEDSLLTIQLTADLVDLVGFEHAPKTADETTAIETLHAALSNTEQADQYIALPPDASCTIKSASTKGGYAPREDDQDEDHHGEDHDDHHGDEHMLTAQWVWECSQMKRLKRLEVSLFEQFPAIVHIKANILTDDKQSQSKLSAKNTSLSVQ
ncbi:MAG: DUF2796 domain-containing protein [Pseudomonadota bacterium]